MRRFAAALALGLAALVGGCASLPDAPAVAHVERREPVTILVSIDGFHPDYLRRGLTPTLSALARDGVTATMQPSFPTKTFPNHWTLVTGLVPDRHGITANKMEDAQRPGETFTMATVDPYWWNDAEPLWVTAERAGIRTAAMFWPGSAVPWGGTARGWGPVEDGILPQDWQQFSMQVSNTQRVNAVIDWLRRPADIRPAFATLYFDTVDTAGHDAGPGSEANDAALRRIDRDIAMLIEGLDRLDQTANLVLVSDHGMAATSSQRVIALDRIVDASLYRMVEGGPYATFEPTPGHAAAFEAAILAPHAHMQCWRKGEIPARFQYGTHARIPPYLCLAETGWTIAPTAPDRDWTGGNHGYDDAAPEMAALFIAHGPAFRDGVELASFRNTAVAPLVRHLLGLPQDPALDGSLAPLRPALSTAD